MVSGNDRTPASPLELGDDIRPDDREKVLRRAKRYVRREADLRLMLTYALQRTGRELVILEQRMGQLRDRMREMEMDRALFRTARELYATKGREANGRS